PRRAGRRRAGDRHRRPRRPDRTALTHDLEGRPVPDARRPANRLGASAAAVERDRHSLEEDLVLGYVGFELDEQVCGTGRRSEEPQHDVFGRLELDELVLERFRKAAVAEVPAVELLEKARPATLAELAHRLADEVDQLGGNLF